MSVRGKHRKAVVLDGKLGSNFHPHRRHNKRRDRSRSNAPIRRRKSAIKEQEINEAWI